MALISKEKTQTGVLSSYEQIRDRVGSQVSVHTFFVPLNKFHIDSLLSIRSPIVYGNELDFAIADATADLRKSIIQTLRRAAA